MLSLHGTDDSVRCIRFIKNIETDERAILSQIYAAVSLLASSSDGANPAYMLVH